jgi:hypothetical protein
VNKKCFIALAAVIACATPPIVAMRIPDQVKDIVAFIFVENPKGGSPIPFGTGFFIGVVKQGTTGGHCYMITARHVLFRPADKKLFSEIYLRLNTLSGGSEIVKVPLHDTGAAKNVFFHSDPTVDLAAIAFGPDEKRHSTKILPNSYLTSKDDFANLGIGDGSDVFFTGLFVSHVGDKRNYPIVRFGRVALLSDEPIDFVDFKNDRVKANLILMEAQSYGGNSGSPVFYYLGSDRQPGNLVVGEPVLKLAGVMSGSFNDIIEVKTLQTAAVSVATPNNGIAAVVPAYKLSELLFSDELKKQRGY